MPKKNGVKQMFRIVSPLLIYYAVSYMVSQIVILWFTGKQWPKFLSENPDRKCQYGCSDAEDE